MFMRRLLATLLVTLLAPAAARAADVRVSYLVNGAELKNNAVAGTPLTFELHTTSACAAAVATAVVNVENVDLLEALKAVGAKNGPKPPKQTEIRWTLTGVTPAPSFFLEVTGTGVVPVGGACQLQYASGGGTLPPPPLSCPPDAVISGSLCVDKYEASLWQIPPASTTLIQQVKDGTATLADLTSGGAVQVGCTSAPYSHAAIPGTFPANGAYTAPIYAASIPGILPSACLSAYQAIAACQLSEKRIMTNPEWTDAALGTPSHVADNGTTDCNTYSVLKPINTGARSGCVSAAGALDMVGNVYEWTVDSGAWFRGGFWGNGSDAGVLAAASYGNPLLQNDRVGFRCAR